MPVSSRGTLPYPSRRSPASSAETATLTTFRINTCKSVSKQRTLTPFRINTYEKPRGRGGTLTKTPVENHQLPRRDADNARCLRHVPPLSRVPSLDCAHFLSPRGWHPFGVPRPCLRRLCALCVPACPDRVGAVNSMLSAAWSLFPSLWPCFKTFHPLFSIACSLFSENTRVGYTPKKRPFGISRYSFFLPALFIIWLTPRPTRLPLPTTHCPLPTSFISGSHESPITGH